VIHATESWLGLNPRFSKDYEYRVQTSEALIDVAAIRIMLNRLAPI
jgi:putative transposase